MGFDLERFRLSPEWKAQEEKLRSLRASYLAKWDEFLRLADGDEGRAEVMYEEWLEEMKAADNSEIDPAEEEVREEAARDDEREDA